MMKTLISIIIILGSVGLIAFFAAPRYQAAKTLKIEAVELQSALDKATELRAARQKLQEKYNSFSNQQLSDLETLLPTQEGNVELLMAVNKIATDNGLVLKDITVEEAEQVITDPDSIQPLGTLDITFSVSGKYGEFVQFLGALERSLRIIDVKSLSFSSAETEQTGLEFNNEYDYSMTVSTYWLRNPRLGL